MRHISRVEPGDYILACGTVECVSPYGQGWHISFTDNVCGLLAEDGRVIIKPNAQAVPNGERDAPQKR